MINRETFELKIVIGKTTDAMSAKKTKLESFDRKERDLFIKNMIDFYNQKIKDIYRTDLDDTIKKKQPHLCAVCLENDVSYSFVPCGHCFCQTCGNQAQRRNRCPNCRNSITSLHRVWL